MKLSRAASRFDRTICFDAYDDHADTFLAQLDVFDDSKKDSLGTSRRILSTAPDVVIPARRAVTFGSFTWLLSAPYPDEFLGAPIRHKYSAQQADGLASVAAFDLVLAGNPGLRAYTAKTLVKTGREEDNARLTNRFDFFFSPGEPINVKDIITLAGRRYIVRIIADMPTDFMKVTVDEVSEPALEAAVYSSKVYQPLTDTYVTSPTMCNMLHLRWELAFEYPTQASVSYEDGDAYGVIRRIDVAAPAAGATVALPDGIWKVLSVQTEGACWGLHLRRA